ncbi:hypothetical protein K438DRAFT_2021253 [Mycena galopus ATCC 62051]|nr:hypothetical protein K438DRAFT_2021253 [Mycena galopus ATCC 62051]
MSAPARPLKTPMPTSNPCPPAQFQRPLTHFQCTRALFGHRPAPYFKQPSHAHAPFEPLPTHFKPLPAHFKYAPAIWYSIPVGTGWFVLDLGSNTVGWLEKLSCEENFVYRTRHNPQPPPE